MAGDYHDFPLLYQLKQLTQVGARKAFNIGFCLFLLK
jgi:hypothetical protein